MGLGWGGQSFAPAGMGEPEQELHHWMAGYCKQGTNGMDGLDGELVGQVWDGRMLAPARTGAPLLALEGRRAM